MGNKPLKILLIASWYPDDNSPFQGSFIEEQAVMLQRRGHLVTVLHPYLLGTFRESFAKKEICEIITRKNITVIRVGAKPILPGSRKLAYSICFKRSMAAFKKFGIDPGSFDIVHSHAAFTGGIIARKLSEKYNLDFFHTEHTSGLIFLPKQYNREDRKQLKELYASARKAFFVSSFALENTLKTFDIRSQEKFRVLHNIVDDSFFGVPHKGLPSIPFRYIAINNLIQRKGVDTLIHAWSKLIQKYPDSTLTIAGNGPLKSELVSLAERLDLRSSISFIPKLNRQEVMEELNSHHVLISASHLETFGLTVAEAQAMGKPVVVTDSGGVLDIVETNTGIITKDDVQDLSDGLEAIQRDFQNYSSVEIRKITGLKFSTGVIYDLLINQYTTN